MGRDSWRSRQHDIEREQRRRVHPAWRGVGCLLLVVLAIGGYLVSNWFLVNNTYYGWIYLPPECCGRRSPLGAPARWSTSPLASFSDLRLPLPEHCLLVRLSEKRRSSTSSVEARAAQN
jgi:hypothetical protein